MYLGVPLLARSRPVLRHRAARRAPQRRVSWLFARGRRDPRLRSCSPARSTRCCGALPCSATRSFTLVAQVARAVAGRVLGGDRLRSRSSCSRSLYNRRVTGSFTQFPITAKDPLDTFGFGLRRLMPIGRDLRLLDQPCRPQRRAQPPRPFRASSSAAGSVRSPRASASGCGGATAQRSRSSRSRHRFPLGYFFFWGNLLSSRAALVVGTDLLRARCTRPPCIFVATTLIAAWRRRRQLGSRPVRGARGRDGPLSRLEERGPTTRSARRRSRGPTPPVPSTAPPR